MGGSSFTPSPPPARWRASLVATIAAPSPPSPSTGPSSSRPPRSPCAPTTPPAWLAPPSSSPAGRTAMLNLTHAAAHRALFKRARWNEALEILYALPIADTVAHYRGPHLEHHLEESPRAAPIASSSSTTPSGSRAAGPGAHLGRLRPPLPRSRRVELVHGTFKDAARDRVFRVKMLAFWVPLLGAAALLGVLGPLFWYWVVPLVWLSPVFLLWGRGERSLSGRPAAPAITPGPSTPCSPTVTPSITTCTTATLRPVLPRAGGRGAPRPPGPASPERSRSALDFVRRVYGPRPLVNAPRQGDPSS